MLPASEGYHTNLLDCPTPKIARGFVSGAAGVAKALPQSQQISALG
jgi:hypothetical protein